MASYCLLECFQISTYFVLAQDVTVWQRLHHILLPAITLSIIGVANIALHTRQKLIEVLNSDYVLFARAQIGRAHV